MYFLVAFLAVTIPWACLYRMDEIGTARGRLEAKGNTIKRESDLEGSVAVLKVYVKKGDVVKAVCYFQAADKYTTVVTRDAELLIRTPLKELLPQLPAGRFRQIHRSTLVNLDEVTAAVRDETGRLSLRLKHRKESLPVSRVFADLFRQM